MALLTISAYKQYNNQGQQVLIIETVGNHGILTSYIYITITGATDNKYNGTFKFYVKDTTTLEHVEEIHEVEAILTQPALVLGTIVANTSDYITLAPEVINPESGKYLISSNGEYQILLDESKLYRINYFSYKNIDAKVGERLDDTDRILYADVNYKPISVYRAKWLIFEIEKFATDIEIRLTILN